MLHFFIRPGIQINSSWQIKFNTCLFFREYEVIKIAMKKKNRKPEIRKLQSAFYALKVECSTSTFSIFRDSFYREFLY